MSKFIDLTGQKFGRLTVIKRVENDKRLKASWQCKCVCGNIKSILSQSLISGKTKGCGCLNSTHHMTKTPEYVAWQDMRNRCYREKTTKFKHYGGRGITVCDEWRNDFMAFFKHIGPRPTNEHSLERINNNGNYEPNNVKWASQMEQCNNKRNNCTITLHGHTMTLRQWSCFTGINYGTLHSRINESCWPIAKAIFQPVRKHK